MPTVTRVFEFDAAHRVLGHQGKCRHLHGHRYKVEVTVQAPDLDHLGMVIDFAVIKDKVGGYIDKYFDHNILLHEQDPLLRANAETEEDMFAGREPVVFRNNPTAENIAHRLLIQSILLLRPLRVTRVRVWETPSCFADATEEDLRDSET